VLRSAAGKERAILIDLRGVSHKHKLPEADREWSLDGDPCALAESEKDVKPIECKECGAEFGGWRISPDGSRSCPSCGVEAPAQELPAIALRELHAAGSAADPDAKMAALESLALQAVAQKFQPGWVAHAFRERFGDWPDRRDSQRALNFARGAT
jgi:DNA repair protein RadD